MLTTATAQNWVDIKAPWYHFNNSILTKWVNHQASINKIRFVWEESRKLKANVRKQTCKILLGWVFNSGILLESIRQLSQIFRTIVKKLSFKTFRLKKVFNDDVIAVKTNRCVIKNAKGSFLPFSFLTPMGFISSLFEANYKRLDWNSPKQWFAWIVWWNN